MARHGMLAHKSSILIDEAALTDARTTMLMEEFNSLHIRIKEMDDGGNSDFSRIRNKSRDQTDAIGDPNAVRAKGCGKRLKSSKEKSISKSNRQCRCCGEHGHDKRTCPQLNDRPSTYQPNMNEFTTTQDDGIDNLTFTSNASSNYDVANWFL
ncbi:Protein FAR1-RELATED SEQUENCE [Abeliophyllum distichum]|uniref:Protein FAR1-RELATED SEQUENCE n=1 Tax=Abeliophyllum distichum TaxID=126358 RepID=A0ABD1VX65_9LAMI